MERHGHGDLSMIGRLGSGGVGKYQVRRVKAGSVVGGVGPSRDAWIDGIGHVGVTDKRVWYWLFGGVG